MEGRGSRVEHCLIPVSLCSPHLLQLGNRRELVLMQHFVVNLVGFIQNYRKLLQAFLHIEVHHLILIVCIKGPRQLLQKLLLEVLGIPQNFAKALLRYKRLELDVFEVVV